jgi:pimeloyl-ACP methyl ester carboxylesterase
MTSPKPSFPRRRFIILGVCLLVAGLFVIVNWLGYRFREQEKDFRIRFRQAVTRWFPEEAAAVAASYGLHYVDGRGVSAVQAVDHPVVLIHGLDDPGKVWMNLAPVLAKADYDVWTMVYPNDQPVAESARFFADQLTILHRLGAERIVIVAHSMGGLVARDMLTDPDIGYDRQVQSGGLPEVAQLIMVGTPNHGSHLAHFRFLTELRDQWVHLTTGRGHWLLWILDGAGEAKIDLLPGSRFLTELNARPHPPGVELAIIAGVIGSWDETEIQRFAASLQRNLPEGKEDLAEELQDWLRHMAAELGDGLVTLESSRLPGVPHQIVPGTHLSIIRNLSEESTRVPPAVPIILEIIDRSGFKNYANGHYHEMD